jgi:hypothetical protein
MRCPGCQGVVAIPDIGARTPPGTEVLCACGDTIGVLYTDDGPVLIWWRPRRPIVVRNAFDVSDESDE